MGSVGTSNQTLSSAMKKLPISIILPTLDCASKLKQHLDACKEWLYDVEQIIAIDSKSTDGTLEILQNSLNGFGATILVTDRGLYRSWNAAISSATQTYTYISTIGDFISFEGLKRLYTIAEAETADVVISVPRMVDEAGQPVSNRWPIHFFKDYIQSKGGIIRPSKQELELILISLLPESIIGSSASNLYRTKNLQEDRFDENIGKSADVSWALNNLPRLRTIIVSEMLSTFMWDGERAGTWDSNLKIKSWLNDFFTQSGVSGEVFLKSLDSALVKYLVDTNFKMMEECQKLESYVRFLEASRYRQLVDKALTYTSVRYWISRLFKDKLRMKL